MTNFVADSSLSNTALVAGGVVGVAAIAALWYSRQR